MARRAVPVVPGDASAMAALLPGANAGEWLLCRRVPAAAPGDFGPGATTRQTFASLEAAAANLEPADSFVLALPIEIGLVQRLSLPAAEPAELEEMARIQLEKILPYPVESIGLSLQEISRTETDVTLAVESIHQDRLTELCEPLLARGCWPRRVAFYPVVLAGGATPEEDAAFVYRSNDKHVLAICEHGRLCFAQVLGGQTAEDLATELPATLLGAELEGVPTSFGHVRLDDGLAEWKDTLAAALSVEITLFDPAGTALQAAPQPEGDLSPAGWHAERQRGERRERLQRRLLLAAVAYAGILLLAFLWLGVRKIQVAHLDSQLAAVRPLATYSKDAANHWRALEPAVEPGESLAEVLKYVTDPLPPNNTVLLTGFDFRPGKLIVTGEAPSSTAAVDYSEKLKAVPQLRTYHLEADQPVLQPTSGRWRFNVATPANLNP